MKFRFAAALAVGLMGIVVLTGSFFLLTEPGLRFLVRRAAAFVPGGFTVDDVRGRLAGPMHFRGVHYSDGGLELELDDLRVDWRPSLLFTWRVDVTKAHLNGVKIHVPPPRPEDHEQALPPAIGAPVPVFLREGVIKDLVIFPVNGQPVKVQRISLEGLINRKGLSVKTLALVSSPIGLQASGQIPSDTTKPLDVQYTWTYQGKDRDPFSGEGNVSGNQERLTLRHRLLSPFTSNTVVHLTDPLGKPSGDFQATFEELSPGKMIPGWPEGNLSGKISGTGRPDSFSVDTGINGFLAGLGDVKGSFTFTREGPIWQVDDGLLKAPSTEMNLSVTGRLDTMDEAAPLSFSARWENLAWPPGSEDPAYTSQRGDLSVQGRLGDYIARFEAHLQGKGVQPGIWTAAGKGDEKSFDLETFHFLLLSGDVRGQGSIRWQDGLSWRYTARGSALDPDLLWEGWPGLISLVSEGRGEQKDGEQTVHLEVSDINGTLRGEDLGGSLELTLDGPLRRVGKFNLALGKTDIKAAGQLDDKWEVEAAFTSGHIGVLLNDAAGSVAGSVNISGPRESPRIRTSLSGSRLAFGPAQVMQAKVEADGALDPDEPFTLDILLKDASLGKWSAQVLSMKGSGSWTKHLVNVDAVYGNGTSSAALDGSSAGGTWTGDLRSSVLDGTLSGRASVGLNVPRRWTAALNAKEVDPGTLWPGLAGDLSFTAEGGSTSADPGNWSARIDDLAGQLRNLPVKGSASVDSSTEGTSVRTLDLQIGKTRLEVSGDIAPAWDLSGEISVPSLKELTPSASGAADLSFFVSGESSFPRITLKGSGSDILFSTAHFDDLSLSAVVGVGPDSPTVIDLTADRGQVGERIIDSVGLSVTGTQSSHSGTFLLRSPMSDADISILGRYGENHWEGKLEGDVLGGAVDLAGKFDLTGPTRWNWEFNASDLDPAQLYEALPERLSLSGQSSGEILETGASGRMRVESLSGSWRGKIFMGQIDLGITPDGLKDTSLNLEMGKGKLSLSGQVMPRWDLEWVMNVPDLSAVMASLGGAVAASGSVTGPNDAPRVRGALKGQNLSFGSMKAGDVNMDADIDPDGSSRVEVGFTEMTAGEFAVQSVSMLAQGPLNSHGLSLTAHSVHADVDLFISGRFREGSWSGEITRWKIASKEMGQWSLVDTASLAFGDTFIAGPVCLGSSDGEACLMARWQSKEREGGGSLRWTGLELGLGEVWLPEGFHLEGSSEGNAQFSFANGTAGLVARMGTTPGSLSFASTGVKGEEELALAFNRLGAELTLDTTGLRGRFEGDLGKDRRKDGGQEGQFLLWTFEIPALAVPDVQPFEDLRVKGQFKARVTDMDLIEIIVPEMAKVKGLLTADIVVQGPLVHPALVGEASITEGSFGLITPGITLEQINIRTILTSDKEAKVRGSITSGGGSLDINGVLLLDPDKRWPITLNFTGERFQLARTPYIRVLVSPDMQIDFSNSEFKAQGTVGVPEASIEPADFSLASTPSADIAVLGRETGVPEAEPITVQADVTFELGDKISFNGFGLTGRIAGNLMVKERPGEPTAAAGELQVLDGEYKAFGRTLAIERGRLIFTGGQIDNPGMDIRAVRQVNEVKAGVQVSGTLLSPVLTLFSEPALGESEILSYLVLGRPLSQATKGDAQVLSQAATAVSLAGGLALAKEIGNAFGLEEVKIETAEETKDSTLVVGKYLSPRLYVQYGVGLFESINIFRFGYQLNRRFLLQGESGVDSGADLIYTIEKK